MKSIATAFLMLQSALPHLSGKTAHISHVSASSPSFVYTDTRLIIILDFTSSRTGAVWFGEYFALSWPPLTTRTGLIRVLQIQGGTSLVVG